MSRPPPVEMKLFVGRVPTVTDEDSLRTIFEKFGPVLEVHILRDQERKKHKGSAFVRMQSITDADAAIRALNGIKVLPGSLNDSPLLVRYADRAPEKLGLVGVNNNPGVDQAKLFVGSLPRDITEEQITDIFQPYGKLDEIYIMKNPTTGEGRGCAFVKFQYKEEAFNAIGRLNGSLTLPGSTKTIEVRFAEYKKPKGGNQGSDGDGSDSRYHHLILSQNLNPRQAGLWKEYFTPQNRPYYHNEETQVTQWERPSDFDSFYGRNAPVAGPAGANVYIFHVPNSWTAENLFLNFGGFGKILSARVAVDPQTSLNKGYGFVSFSDVQSAARAVHAMNGWTEDNKKLKVSIKQHEEIHAQHLVEELAKLGPGGTGPVSQESGAFYSQFSRTSSLEAEEGSFKNEQEKSEFMKSNPEEFDTLSKRVDNNVDSSTTEQFQRKQSDSDVQKNFPTNEFAGSTSSEGLRF
eukprot:GHVP01060930.1.p1 GENE.GHVP01060930.1~~GHVP01060930.1.p1  ORF type:complete len:463 (+),score=78.17 GHVP01060930.1:33-1421(+)